MTGTPTAHMLALIIGVTSIAAGYAGADMYGRDAKADHQQLDKVRRQDLWVLTNLLPVGQDDRLLLGTLTTMTPTQCRSLAGEADLYAKHPIAGLEPGWGYDGLDGLPVKMSVAEWFYRASPARTATAKPGTLGIQIPAAIALGLVALGVLGWWLRRYT